MDNLYILLLLRNLVLILVDLERKSLPVEYTGSGMRNFIGFELTGEDFVIFDRVEEEVDFWKETAGFHDVPFGRYEQLDIQFEGNINSKCGLTNLPAYCPRGSWNRSQPLKYTAHRNSIPNNRVDPVQNSATEILRSSGSIPLAHVREVACFDEAAL